MRGKHQIRVSDNRVVYDLTIVRNITIIRGDSATGKTTLLEMLDTYLRYGDDSGISVECDVPISVYLSDNRRGHWREQLSNAEGSIVFIEELNPFVNTKEFAEYISTSGSYYVLITRWSLKNLPYSVEEIYKLTEKGKYPGTRKIYNGLEHYYESDRAVAATALDKVITEDAKAGFEFYQVLCKNSELLCESAFGNSNIIKCMRTETEKVVLYIADGAAFGAYMDDCMSFLAFHRNAGSILWLPESFEFLILKAGIPEIPNLADILEHTFDYVDSENYIT